MIKKLDHEDIHVVFFFIIIRLRDLFLEFDVKIKFKKVIIVDWLIVKHCRGTIRLSIMEEDIFLFFFYLTFNNPVIF